MKDQTRGVSEEFPLTHWSAVFAAGKEGTERAEAALAELCGTYWYPLYAFARRKGHQPADAQDLTQSFFAYLIDTQLVVKADPEKGRFRSFLLGCFINFMASEKEHTQARKRGGGHLIVPLDSQQAEARLAREPSRDVSPERLFDRQWETFPWQELEYAALPGKTLPERIRNYAERYWRERLTAEHATKVAAPLGVEKPGSLPELDKVVPPVGATTTGSNLLNLDGLTRNYSTASSTHRALSTKWTTTSANCLSENAPWAASHSMCAE